MTERQARILADIINEYVRTGELISSGFLAKNYDFGIRPASIRNEMLHLEHEGYLVQPHTSAGRMPTDRAYRFFADGLVEANTCDVDYACKHKIKEAIYSSQRDARSINRALAQVLSELSDNLVITNISNSDEFYKTGLSGLFEFPEMREVERISNLASFFDEFEGMFNEMMNDFFGDSDFNMYIGEENFNKKMKDETIMVARYQLPNNLIGSVTLVGPIRMNYEKNIGLVKYAAEELNKLSIE